MPRIFAVAVAGAALVGAAVPASAALPQGTTAPDFTTDATLAGKPFTFSLADALKKGPVVLYFYPAAFTAGCTAEAHAFAAAMPQFEAMHATVIGVSHDTIETLNKFSVSECQSKFPVAADPKLKITRAYDDVFMLTMANRTSYVISPQGKVIYTYSNLNPGKHVENTLAAVKTYAASHS